MQRRTYRRTNPNIDWSTAKNLISKPSGNLLGSRLIKDYFFLHFFAGRCITAMGQKYHPEHFVCSFCLKALKKGTFKEQSDKPYCHACFNKLFGWRKEYARVWKGKKSQRTQCIQRTLCSKRGDCSVPNCPCSTKEQRNFSAEQKNNGTSLLNSNVVVHGNNAEPKAAREC